MRKPKRKPLRFEQIDLRCREDILRQARGDPSAWPGDNYSTHGTYQERFNRGDKQMMLWAIVLDAEDGKLTPAWAIDQLRRALIETAGIWSLAAQLLSAITDEWKVSTNRNPQPKMSAF